MKSILVGAASALLLLAVEGRSEAQHLIYPKFDSGPAVIARSVSSGSIDASTVIFGRRGGTISTMARQGSNSVWWYGPSELISLGTPGGVDSDPTATYLEYPQIMICFHAAGAGAPFYCSIGSVNYQSGTPTTPILFSVVYGPKPAGAGGFPVGANPAVVRTGTDVFLFGRGQDGQIWNAVTNLPRGAVPNWQGWWQISPISGGFSSDPAAVALDDNGGLQVCARKTGGNVACARRLAGGSWGPWVDAFSESTVYKPALTRSSNALWLLHGSESNVFGRYTLNGSPPWSSRFELGSGFTSGPAVVAVPSSTSVLGVARGGDSNFYYGFVGSNSWTRIQAYSTYTSN
jgi:hypothetical protein